MDKHDAYCYGLAIGFALKVAAKHDLSTESGRDAFAAEVYAETDKDDSPYILEYTYNLLKGVVEAISRSE